SEPKIPIDSTTNLPNWDCPDAIDFTKFIKTLRHVHQTGSLPDSFKSKERFNTRNDTQIEAQLESLNKQLSNRITLSINNLTDWKFILVDGFLLYWDMQVVKELDIKLF
ncbi:1383_t:CDS:1, partial [Gigaspora rosea]